MSPDFVLFLRFVNYIDLEKVHTSLIQYTGVPHKAGWAFGLGLERIAMILFSIPDIRLFWSTDKRFLSQFEQGSITNFKPYSRYPECYKDVSFWLRESSIEAQGTEAGVNHAGGKIEKKGKLFHENDFCEIVRDVAGDLIETVELVRLPVSIFSQNLTYIETMNLS